MKQKYNISDINGLQTELDILNGNLSKIKEGYDELERKFKELLIRNERALTYIKELNKRLEKLEQISRYP